MTELSRFLAKAEPEKFLTDLELAKEAARAGDSYFARINFHRAMERAEFKVHESDRLNARKLYTRFYNDYLN